MRKALLKAVLIACVTLFVTMPAMAALSPAFTTGEDWTRHMSEREKFMSILIPMSIFHEYGVPFRLSPDKYIAVIDNVIDANPQIENEDISNIFASTVYLYEPESRPAFDAMEMNFLRADYRPADVRLTLSLDGEAAPAPGNSADNSSEDTTSS